MDKNNIILIGFMGVGKGTIARSLYSLTKNFCIDTDDLIESLKKMKIKDIFSKHGEDHFRELEKECSEWLEKSISNSIISTGGGFYKQKNLKNIGKVIYLESSFDEILNRINSSSNSQAKLNKRPLLININEARKLYNSRINEYKSISDISVNVEKKEPIKIAKEILKKLGEIN
ncbi:MAG: AAA family ATPase [Campylobacterales bacterium]|nr:AAA family ATPase [Campylobacterales bacterium]